MPSSTAVQGDFSKKEVPVPTPKVSSDKETKKSF